jgi:hypothetical protein
VFDVKFVRKWSHIEEHTCSPCFCHTDSYFGVRCQVFFPLWVQKRLFSLTSFLLPPIPSLFDCLIVCLCVKLYAAFERNEIANPRAHGKRDKEQDSNQTSTASYAVRRHRAGGRGGERRGRRCRREKCRHKKRVGNVVSSTSLPFSLSLS